MVIVHLEDKLNSLTERLSDQKEKIASTEEELVKGYHMGIAFEIEDQMRFLRAILRIHGKKEVV